MKYCMDCNYYIKNSVKKSSCKRFIKYKNIVTNDTKYMSCEQCRNDELFCGMNGRFFTKASFFKRLFR